MKIRFGKNTAVLLLLMLLFLAISPVQGQDDGIIVTPSVSVASPGETFEVHVALDSNVTDVMLYLVHLRYDSTVIRFVDAWPESAWYNLSDAGTQYFIDSIVVEEDTLSGDSLWYLLLFDIIWSGIPKVTIDGYAEIATLQFEAVANGATYLYFDTAIVKNPQDSIVVESVANGLVYVCPLPPGFTFAGDLDGSNGIDIADLVYLVDYMFTGGPPPPISILSADLDCNLGVDIADLVYLVDYMFTGGPEPCDHCP